MIYRNKRLLEACRQLPCQVCGIEDGTVVAAHRNEGKGIGMKVSDALVAAMCFKCHHDCDNGKSMNQSQRRELWDRAYIRTMKTMIERGVLRVK